MDPFSEDYQPPDYTLTITDMLTTFGAFMAVLIAIEIFINTTVYLREDVILVKMVMATALMATEPEDVTKLKE